MVHLVLSSTKGNQGLRYFPHSGYLGLTPVKVEGVVRTKFDDDMKPLQAKSVTISVRCYESRLGRVGVLHSNVLVDHTQVLWTKPDDVEYGPLGEMEFPFRIILPATVAGFSTSVFVDYRCSWRVEAVINHAPISGIGSRQIKHFELPLVRYDLPPYEPTPVTPPRLSQAPTKSRSARIQYTMNPPTIPIGPQDLVSIPVYLLPLDAAISIRSINASIERRIALSSSSDPPTPPTSPPASTPIALTFPRTTPSPQSHSPPWPSSHLQADGSTSVTSLSSSTPTLLPNPFDTCNPSTASIATEARPLLSSHSDTCIIPSTPCSKIITNTIVSTETSGQFTLDEKGVWSKTLTLQWPPQKPNSRWATGETIQSDFVSVKFFARVKVVISSPFGTESIDLPEKELLVVSTNDSERQLAKSKYEEALQLNSSEKPARSKSKSPRRSRRDRDNVPPSPAPIPGSRSEQLFHTASASTPYPSNGGPSKLKATGRRPHTSAGPRDSSFHVSCARAEGVFTRSRDDRGHELETEEPGDSSRKRRATRPDSSQSETKARSFIFSPRMSFTPSGSSHNTSTTASTSDVSSSSLGSLSDEMKAWEEELARIEIQSRRSSDMLGFSGKQKRSVNLVRVAPLGEGKA